MFYLTYADTRTPSATTPKNQSAELVAIAARNNRKIEGKFSKLVTKSRKRLQSKEVDVEEVQDFLITMYSSPNSRDGSDTVTTVLESAVSLEEIFRALSKYKVWDYLNYYLLQSINEEFASDDDELNALMDQYQRDLTGHVLTQKIQTYLDANKYPVATSDSESSADENITSLPAKQKHKLYRKLSAEVKANITDHSVKYVYDLWRSLANQFRLPRPAMILHSIAEGCICITWLIPANLVTHVMRMAQVTANMFAKHQILKVMLEEDCIYPMETELETEHTLLEPEPSLSEIKVPPPLAKSPPLKSKPLSLGTRPPPLKAELPLTETKPLLPETELPPTETKPSPPETELPLTETKLPPLETELPLTETKLPPLETELPLTETKPSQPDTELPLTETKFPPLETELPPTETKPSQPDTELPLTETKPSPPETELPLTETKLPPLETELPLTETKPSQPDTELPLTETKLPPLETEPPLTETKPSQPDTELPLTETKLPPPETELPLTETKLPPPETELPLTETKLPPLETELPLTETRPLPPDTEFLLTETKLPPLETELPLTETKLPPLETELPLTETKPPPPETELPLTETKLLPPETELPPLDSEVAAPKRKVCKTGV